MDLASHRRERDLPKATGPWLGAPNADHWKSTPTTRFACRRPTADGRMGAMEWAGSDVCHTRL